MFKDAFENVETQEWPNQAEFGICPNKNIYSARTTGVIKAVDFTQTAFNEIKKRLSNDSLIPLDDLHAYIAEYYYWKVFKISVNHEGTAS